MIRWLEDCLLGWLQRRCRHPGQLCAVDISEGAAGGLEVAYCNRCGAVKLQYPRNRGKVEWRRPDPHLWRDWRATWERIKEPFINAFRSW